MLIAVIWAKSLYDSVDSRLSDCLGFFIMDLVVQGAIFILHEDGLVKVEEAQHHLADGWLVDVQHKLVNHLLVLVDVLEDVSRVAAYKHSEQIAPVPTKNRVQLLALQIEEAQKSLEKFVLRTLSRLLRSMS